MLSGISLSLAEAHYSSSIHCEGAPTDSCSTWFWDLAGQYPTLEALNPVAHLPRAKWVSLNPFAPDQHFIVFEDSTTHYSLPPQWASDIAQLFQQYARQTVQYANQATHPQSYLGPQNYGGPGRMAQAHLNTSPGLSSPSAYSYCGPPSIASPTTSPQPAQPEKKQKFWQRKNGQTQPQSQSNIAFAPPSSLQVPNLQGTVPLPAPAAQNSFDFNGAMQLGNNVLDAYNNITNASGQTTSTQFDVNQAVSTMNGSLATINQVNNYGSQGLDLVNQITDQGLMVGQLAGQFGGAMLGCCVM